MPIYKLNTSQSTVSVHHSLAPSNGSVSLRETLNGDVVCDEAKENGGHDKDKEVQRTTSAEEEKVSDTRKSVNRKESIIEREIREQLKREEELAVLHGIIFSRTTTADPSDPKVDLAPERSMVYETEVLPPEPQSTSRVERKITMIRSPDGDTSTTTRVDTVISGAATTTNEGKPVRMDYRHGGEEIILNELMWQKEREEELRRNRKEMGVNFEVENLENGRGTEGNNNSEIEGKDDGVDSAVVQTGFEGTGDGMTVSLVRDKDSERPGKEELEKRHSFSERSRSISSSSTQRRNSQRVQPFEEVELIQSELFAQYVPQNETPIEREIRVAGEREEALRVTRGLLSLPSRRSQEAEIVVVKPRVVDAGNEERNQDYAMKMFAECRLRSELEREKRREIDLLKEGKIKLLSEQRAPELTRHEEVKAFPENEELRELSKRRSLDFSSSSVRGFDSDTAPDAERRIARTEYRTESNANPMRSYYHVSVDGGEREGVTVVKADGSGSLNNKRVNYENVPNYSVSAAEQRIENEVAEHRKRESELREQRRLRNSGILGENHVTHPDQSEHGAHAQNAKPEVAESTSSEDVTEGSRRRGGRPGRMELSFEQTTDSVDFGKPHRLALIDQWERGIIQRGDIAT